MVWLLLCSVVVMMGSWIRRRSSWLVGFLQLAATPPVVKRPVEEH